MQTVHVNRNDFILQIKLNRPRQRNAFNPVMIDGLIEAFTVAAADPALRLVYLTGVGRDFCVGADLNWMKSFVGIDFVDNQADAKRLFSLYESMINCKNPIVTYVHGHVFAGGIGLCAASDIVVADESAVFALSETKRGIVPAVMLPFVCDKLSKSRTRELLMTGREFSAQEALQYGLVHFITNTNQSVFMEQLFQSILATAPVANYQSRQLINHLVRNSYDSQTKDLLVTALAESRIDSEAIEGIKAFFEKRQPNWLRKTA